MTSELEDRFHIEMIAVYDRAKKERGYTATRFYQMVNNHGGLASAKMLLASKHHPEGLTRLWEEGRLDISMEALVRREPWRTLFSNDELAVAEGRLEQLGYKET